METRNLRLLVTKLDGMCRQLNTTVAERDAAIRSKDKKILHGFRRYKRLYDDHARLKEELAVARAAAAEPSVVSTASTASRGRTTIVSMIPKPKIRPPRKSSSG